jgi:transcriptional regulator GlxA family with amidase domain
MALTTVRVLAPDGVAVFELGVIAEVFGMPRPDDPLLPDFDFAVCTVRPGEVPTSSGFGITVEHGLDALAGADLIAVPAFSGDEERVPEPELLEALRDASVAGARVLSVCSGAFLLGHAGLLDGRRCTTHWLYAERLQRLFPAARVDPRVLYVDDGQVLTSAGTAAGIDLCLHVIRSEFGEKVANRLARRMVVPPHRDGGQAQYVDMPIPVRPAESLDDLLTWMREHLADDLAVETLAARAHMSPRTFARRFRAETGTTPFSWLTGQRILLAQRLLEETDLPIDAIATRCGFGTAPVLRHHFARWRGTTPQAYRRTFARRSA